MKAVAAKKVLVRSPSGCLHVFRTRVVHQVRQKLLEDEHAAIYYCFIVKQLHAEDLRPINPSAQHVRLEVYRIESKNRLQPFGCEIAKKKTFETFRPANIFINITNQ